MLSCISTNNQECRPRAQIININSKESIFFTLSFSDYENCKCRKKLVDKLVGEYTETVKDMKLAKIALAEHESRGGCSSCTLYIVLISAFFTINVGLGSYFLYFYWYLKKDVTRVNLDTRTQTTI